jgi:hypothetical protein
MSTVLEALDALGAKGNRPGWPATEARSRYAVLAVEHLRRQTAELLKCSTLLAESSYHNAPCIAEAEEALAALQRDIEAMG